MKQFLPWCQFTTVTIFTFISIYCRDEAISTLMSIYYRDVTNNFYLDLNLLPWWSNFYLEINLLTLLWVNGFLKVNFRFRIVLGPVFIFIDLYGSAHQAQAFQECKEHIIALHNGTLMSLTKPKTWKDSAERPISFSTKIVKWMKKNPVKTAHFPGHYTSLYRSYWSRSVYPIISKGRDDHFNRYHIPKSKTIQIGR